MADNEIDLSKIRKFEIDLSRGIAKADGPDDHARMMEALAMMKSLQAGVAPAQMPSVVSNSPAPVDGGTVAAQHPNVPGLRLPDLVDKFFNLKSQLKPATILAYKKTVNEFAKFLGNPLVHTVSLSDVTRFQEHLTKANGPRTIDNKMATLRTIFFFAIRQGYYFKENPAVGRQILSKSDKIKAGYGIFALEQIKSIYGAEYFKDAKTADPDYYWVLMLGLFTGCRISEITSLTAKQVFVDGPCPYIRILESKTLAGIRSVPIPVELVKFGLGEFVSGKTGQIFKYKLRLGKGSGNAVGQKFKRHLEAAKVTGDKLVFHSLRKFANDFFLKAGVPFEPRCQFFGHEIDSVNVQLYSDEFNVDELAEIVRLAHVSLLMHAGVMQTKF